MQRLHARAVYKCLKCDNRIYIRRKLVTAFNRYARCPQCGTRRNLSKLRSIDRVDRLNKNPLRLLLRLFGAPLYHCTFCRLQFWDFRSRESGPR
jgi:DNA-directed RNA polymerase subunit RPC12/RpoP